MSVAARRKGGKRPGAGRLQQRLSLSPETARKLSTLLSDYRTLHPDATAEDFVTLLISNAHEDLMAFIDEKVKEYMEAADADA